MKIHASWMVALLLMPAALAAQEPKSQPAPTPTRPDGNVRTPVSDMRVSNRVFVGEEAPDFELSNLDGHPVQLSRYRGDRVLLTFANRRDMLVPFAAIAESLHANGVSLVGICHDSPQSLRTLATRERLPFELLSDPTGEISAMFGAYDYGESGIVPGFVLVGRRGLVRMVFLGQMLPPSELLELTRYALTGQ
jgi:peroxiredoxin